MSIYETVKTQKWYYVRNMRSAYFPINKRLCVCSERERARKREREAMSICEMVKTQKWYYLCNMRSAYFPIDRRLHRERERNRERDYVHPCNGENTEMVLCPSMKW